MNVKKGTPLTRQPDGSLRVYLLLPAALADRLEHACGLLRCRPTALLRALADEGIEEYVLRCLEGEKAGRRRTTAGSPRA
jgi:hypothetical protein